MKIGEASEILGISISNIRFYEKKGLIGPARDKESKYRNYTEDDINDIKQIIVLRKMGMSIETISDILKEETSVEEALEKQVETLEEEQAKIYASMKLCQKALGDNSKSVEDMLSLFDYVAEEEQQGVRFAPAEEFIDSIAVALNYDNIVTTLPWGFMIYTNPVFNYIGKIVWAAYFIIVPLILAVAIFAKSEDPKGKAKLVILVVWLLTVCYGTYQASKVKKINRDKA
ncbi:MerR family transcriptional regulator [Pseudobutyrivibrio sp. MD2005]|uniref:MerR family transcriptional regulator n=1 Tax=Pseudobutyrivibrio sp. MD2005 TaxID=1410616 RepID=UPI000684DD8D|nr:MerR family transcriptional regulator [Pseudobutyrivibrio sp. MD2005]